MENTVYIIINDDIVYKNPLDDKIVIFDSLKEALLICDINDFDNFFIAMVF
jgi:hypothetical protein